MIGFWSYKILRSIRFYSGPLSFDFHNLVSYVLVMSASGSDKVFEGTDSPRNLIIKDLKDDRDR